jgi:hypothetical protein
MRFRMCTEAKGSYLGLCWGSKEGKPPKIHGTKTDCLRKPFANGLHNGK